MPKKPKAAHKPAPVDPKTQIVQSYALIGERQYLIAKLSAEINGLFQKIDALNSESQGK